MATTHDKFITLRAGEALEPYRRVKYNGSTDGYVVYADAADGDSWIGVTLPNAEGDGVALGDQVTVQLRGENCTLKVETSAAVTGNASIYPENDGKVSDDAGTVIIGTAAGESVAGGSGGVIEMHPNAGSGSVPDEEAIANADATNGQGIPFVIRKEGVTASGDTQIPGNTRKLKIIGGWTVLRNATTATTVKVKVGGTDVSLTAALATADDNVLLDVNDAVTEVTTGATVYINLSATATAPGVDTYLVCLPIA